MRKDFMKAAKCVGKYLSVATLSFALVACGGEASAESGRSVHKQQTTHTQETPFPDYPAKFEGCIVKDKYTPFAIAENEGMTRFGIHPLIQTPKDGVHSFITFYNEKDDYGYVLTDKADGQLCVSQTLKDWSFKEVGNYTAISNENNLSQEDCNFTARYSNTCGTFNRLATALTSKGFEIDFQAVNESGHIDTLLSGNGKSYRLTTNSETGATVITGNATQEFVFTTIPNKQPKQVLARN